MGQMFVGIDVAEDRLDVHVRPLGEAFSVARDGKGLDELVARLCALDVALIVPEATGGFETTVAGALCAAGLPLAVVNPRQIRDFARATGRLAKTDALDAAAIAHFADVIRPDPRPVPDAQARSLGELISRRRRLSRACASSGRGLGSWMRRSARSSAGSCCGTGATRPAGGSPRSPASACSRRQQRLP